MSAPGWGRCASHTGQVFSLVTQLIAFLTTRPVSVRLRGVASASSLPGHVKAPGRVAGAYQRASGRHRQGCGGDGLDAVRAEAGPVILAGHDDGGLLVAEALNEGKGLRVLG